MVEDKNRKNSTGKKTTTKKVVSRRTSSGKISSKSVQHKKTSTTKGENAFLIKVKKIVSSYGFLYGTFAVLLILVAVLAGMVFVKQKEVKKNESNIVIPVLEDGNRSIMNIDLAELKKTGEYVIKVTNYRGDKVNTENFDYSITVRNVSGADIKVTKDDSKDNLIVDKEATIIEGVGFGTEKKEEDIYHFTVNDKEKIKKDSVISLEIVTQKKSS